MATPKQTDPQFKLRFTPELRDAIDAAAKVNNRSMNAEIVARLEESGDVEGYQELAELFLETMKENAARARREVEEYRQMSTTIRLMRHIIERFRALSGEGIPDDLQDLLRILNPTSKAIEDNPYALMAELSDSMERRDKMLEEQSDEAVQSKARDEKIRRLVESLNRRIQGADED